MKKKIFNTISYFLVFFVVLISLLFIFSYQKMRSETPSLLELSQRLNPFSGGFVFRYSNKIDDQISNIFYGSHKADFFRDEFSQGEYFPKNFSNPNPNNFGASGFFIFDVRPNYGENFVLKLDDVLDDFLFLIDFQNDYKIKKDIFENSALENVEKDNKSDILATPLEKLLEETWNGKTFLIGGATQFVFSFKDSFLVNIQPYLKNISRKKTDLFRDMIINNMPKNIEYFLNKRGIHVEITPQILTLDGGVYQSRVVLSLSDEYLFVNSVCSEKIDPLDFCGRFSMDRKNFRQKIHSLLHFLNQDFSVSFNVYWTTRGKDIIYSNQPDFMKQILNENKKEVSKNIFTNVTSSGDDFLLSDPSRVKDTKVAVYLDMIRAQVASIGFFEVIKEKSRILSDYFASPAGELKFSLIESKISDLTYLSQKASIAFRTDGVSLFPEMRLYAPPKDIFTKSGDKLTPEFVYSIKLLFTRSLLLGGFVQQEPILPLSNLVVTRNGRWVIIRSMISVKNVLAYLRKIERDAGADEVESNTF